VSGADGRTQGVRENRCPFARAGKINTKVIKQARRRPMLTPLYYARICRTVTLLFVRRSLWSPAEDVQMPTFRRRISTHVFSA